MIFPQYFHHVFFFMFFHVVADLTCTVRKALVVHRNLRRVMLSFISCYMGVLVGGAKFYPQGTSVSECRERWLVEGFASELCLQV